MPAKSTVDDSLFAGLDTVAKAETEVPPQVPESIRNVVTAVVTTGVPRIIPITKGDGTTWSTAEKARFRRLAEMVSKNIRIQKRGEDSIRLSLKNGVQPTGVTSVATEPPTSTAPVATEPTTESEPTETLPEEPAEPPAEKPSDPIVPDLTAVKDVAAREGLLAGTGSRKTRR